MAYKFLIQGHSNVYKIVSGTIVEAVKEYFWLDSSWTEIIKEI